MNCTRGREELVVPRNLRKISLVVDTTNMDLKVLVYELFAALVLVCAESGINNLSIENDWKYNCINNLIKDTKVSCQLWTSISITRYSNRFLPSIF